MNGNDRKKTHAAVRFFALVLSSPHFASPDSLFFLPPHVVGGDQHNPCNPRQKNRFFANPHKRHIRRMRRTAALCLIASTPNNSHSTALFSAPRRISPDFLIPPENPARNIPKPASPFPAHLHNGAHRVFPKNRLKIASRPPLLSPATGARFKYNYTMGAAAAFLDRFTIKKPIEFQGLAVFPVCRVGEIPADEPEVRSLSEGLKSGRILVHETGRMEAVTVMSLDSAPALIMDGETLVGGAQNRMLHTAAVVAPGEQVEMPASCVELRRWDMPHSGEPHSGKPRGGEPIIGELPPEKRHFTRSDVAFASLRHQRMADMERSLRAENKITVDQQRVWAAIANRFGVSGARTKTLDLHDLYEEWDAALRVVTDRFHLAPGQTGMIAFLDRDTWFADIFFTRDLMAKQYKKILKGIAFEALIRLEAEVSVPPSRRPKPEHARDAMRGLRVAGETPTPDRRGLFLSSPKCFGFAALCGGAVASLSACSRKFWMAPALKANIFDAGDAEKNMKKI